MFPGTNISDDLMNEPENLKKLIESVRIAEKVQKAIMSSDELLLVSLD